MIRDEQEKVFPKITDPDLHKTLFGYPVRKDPNQTESKEPEQPEPKGDPELTEESELEVTCDRDDSETNDMQQNSTEYDRTSANNRREKTACLDIGCLAGVDVSKMQNKHPDIKIKELRCKAKVQIFEEVQMNADTLEKFLLAKVDKRIQKLGIQYDSYKSYHTKNDISMPSEVRQKSAEIEMRLKELKRRRGDLELGRVSNSELMQDFERTGLTMVEFEEKSSLDVFESRKSRARGSRRAGAAKRSSWYTHFVEEVKFKEYIVALQALVERFDSKFEKIGHVGLVQRVSLEFPIQNHVEALNQYIGMFMYHNILDEWSLEQLLRNTESPLASARFLVEYFQMYTRHYKESVKKFPGPNVIPDRDYADRTNEELLQMIEEGERQTIKTLYEHLQARIESSDNSRKGKLLKVIQKELTTGRFPENVVKMFESKMKDLREMKDTDSEFSALKTVLEKFLSRVLSVFLILGKVISKDIDIDRYCAEILNTNH